MGAGAVAGITAVAIFSTGVVDTIPLFRTAVFRVCLDVVFLATDSISKSSSLVQHLLMMLVLGTVIGGIGCSCTIPWQ